MSKEDDPTKRVVVFPADYEITDFHYDFVERLTGERLAMMFNDMDLFGLYIGLNISNPNAMRDEGKIREYWMEKIEREYGIDIRDIDDELLNVARVGSELERRLEWREIKADLSE